MENSEYIAYRRSIKDCDRGCIRKRKCDYSDTSDDDAPKKKKTVAVPKKVGTSEVFDGVICLDGVQSGDVLHTKIALNNDVSECEKEADNCYGESNCGRLRLALACLTKKKSRILFDALLNCTGTGDVVELLKSKAQLHFYYAGRDNLSDSISGDGLCSVRNAMVLQQHGT